MFSDYVITLDGFLITLGACVSCVFIFGAVIITIIVLYALFFGGVQKGAGLGVLILYRPKFLNKS